MVSEMIVLENGQTQMLIRLTVAVSVTVAVGLFDGDEVEVSCKD